MKRFLYILCTVTCLFMGCKDDEDREWSPDDKSARTVLVYMAGENNLTLSNGHRYLRSDLNEIIEGSKLLADNQRLLVFVDSLNNNSKQAGKPFIMEVHGGKTIMRHEFESEFYSCDPDRFSEIIQWMTTNAPADDYGLVLWGHACGWAVSNDTIAESTYSTRAYGQDYGTDGSGNGTKWMNITQMARALERLPMPKLSFIFADCCNIMCAEVGYELRNVTNYLIGSPAEIPGDGAPYEKMVPYFYKSGSELYRGIIDTYYNDYLEEYEIDQDLESYSVPLSVIDTKYIGQLAQATHDVLDKFTDGYPAYPSSPDMGHQVYYWYFDGPIMYDMRAFIKNHTSDADFAQWDQAFKQAVPYYRMSMEWMTIYANLEMAFYDFDQDESKNGCVSMFIPKNINGYYNGTFHYNSTYNNFGWNRVMDWSRFGWSY